MRIRFSTCLGLPVVEDLTDEAVAQISGILIDPDLAKIEGFFVSVPRFLRSDELFLSVLDIIHWGTTVRMKNSDVLAPLSERVRLSAMFEDGRTILGQRIITEAGKAVGRCVDVQFETKMFMVEWLFPKKFFRLRPAIPVSAVVQVRQDAIVVRDPLLGTEVRVEQPAFQPLEALTNPPTVSSRTSSL